MQDYPSGLTACRLQHGKDAVAMLWAGTADEEYWLNPRELPKETRTADTMGNPVPLGSRDYKLTIDHNPVYPIIPNMGAAIFGGKLGEIINARFQ